MSWDSWLQSHVNLAGYNNDIPTLKLGVSPLKSILHCTPQLCGVSTEAEKDLNKLNINKTL